MRDKDDPAQAARRTLGDDERTRFISVQHQANRWTYLGSGMSHPNFLDTLGDLSPGKRRMIEAATPSFS